MKTESGGLPPAIWVVSRASHLLGRHALELDRDVRVQLLELVAASPIIGVSLTQEAKVIVTGSVGSGISGLRLARSSCSPIGPNPPASPPAVPRRLPRAEPTRPRSPRPERQGALRKRRRLSRPGELPQQLVQLAVSTRRCPMLVATMTSLSLPHVRVPSLGGPLDPPVCLSTVLVTRATPASHPTGHPDHFRDRLGPATR